jgi:hypothetical protein
MLKHKKMSKKNKKRTKKMSRITINDIQSVNMNSVITKYIENDEWEKIINLIKDGKYTNLNGQLLNGNNVFHLACVRGKTKIIKEMLRLKNERLVTLNTGILDANGIPGIHLYYKYGGIDVSFLNDDDICHLDTNNKNLAIYVLDRIDVFETLINKLIEKECLENIEIPDTSEKHYLFFAIAKKIASLSSIINTNSSKIESMHVVTEHRKDSELNQCNHLKERYLLVLEKLYNKLPIHNLVFIAIYVNSTDIIKMLIRHNFNFLVYIDGMSSIARTIIFGRIEIMILILEYTKIKQNNYDVYKLINSSGREYDNRPIFIALERGEYAIIKILISYMIPYIQEYEKKNKTSYLFTREIDNYHNTYLHNLLIFFSEKNNTSDVIIIDIIKFFIQHTDLNQQNYAGNTPAHFIFSRGIWKDVKDLLIGRNIDLLKIDDIGNNCYSYILPQDKKIFMELVKDITMPINIKNEMDDKLKTFNIDTVKSIMGIEVIDNENPPKNYGLFGNTSPYYMLYLRYLENKYPNFYIPSRIYNNIAKERDLFFFDLTAYNLSDEQALLNRNVKGYITQFYSYLPHNIYWINEDQYYIDPNLINILIQHNKNVDILAQRYVMLKLSIIITSTVLHANSLIYDRLNKEAWRFESYGISDMVGLSKMDKKIHEVLEQVYGKITYHDPDDYLSGLNFQLVDGEDSQSNQNLGDPGGYCLAWSLWFIEAVLTNSDKTVDIVMRKFFDRQIMTTIISEEEGTEIKSSNYFLDFIRRYAHKLDREKNKILESIGIKKYHLYNSVFGPDILSKIAPIFRIQAAHDLK